jgi:ADP-ribose pyrophosphatase YjhB (NUDIX family)
VAGIVLNQAGQVLVVQRRDNGHWEPPGGILERDETFEAGVVREVAEETGVAVQVERLTGVYKNMRRSVVAIVYLCRAVGGSAHVTSESRATRWIAPDEVPALMEPAYAVRVADALTPVGVASRSHDGRAGVQ